MRYSVAIGLFPDNRGSTFISPDIWVGRLLAKLETDPECHAVDIWYKEFGDTPITMLRNRFMRDCENRGADFALMIDSDNKPDLYLGIDPEAKPFWDSSLAFLRAHNGPCVIAAPYCGSPPDEGVHAFRWVTHESNNPNPDFALKTITRDEAVYQRGIKLCAAAATGVMLIDMRGVKKLDHPRFYYEWKDETECDKASTEDVVFTRNLSYAGVPTYINWDAWAGHIKPKMVGRPVPIHIPSVTRQLRRQARAMVERKEDKFAPTQEPPIRVNKNSRPELPPTWPAELTTPAGMTFLQAGDESALEAWKEGRRQDAEAEPKTAADLVREQHDREVVDATWPSMQPVKGAGPGTETQASDNQPEIAETQEQRERRLFEECYPELKGAPIQQ